MKDIIQQIMNQENLDEIYGYAQNALFKDGPVSITTLEILSYLKLFAPDYFSAVEEEILSIMGIFYKKPTARTLQSKLFELYSEHIRQTYHHDYTPVQANILKQIQANQHFSFSAPTSTGKSHVFRHLIETSKRDVAIIVPSRALINEYYDRICELISDKSVNILTFVDIINTRHSNRTVFILTPERAKELFKHKDKLDLEFVLFDEAQLSDEDSTRGLFFDSIVRRIQSNFPETKCVFAHPFVSNPEAQLQKNNFDIDDSKAFCYLNGRTLSEGEESVLNTAIKILLWKIHCKTFKAICWYRYAYVARIPERRAFAKKYRAAKSQNERQRIRAAAVALPAKFIRGYDDIPNKSLPNYSIYKRGTKATDVDYDRIVFDTYDYLDKLISFKLSDIFYAIFSEYYKRTNDIRALKMAQYFKYGTDNENEIWMLRYGLSFEDIEILKPYIVSIGQEEIVFSADIQNLSPEQIKPVKRYL